MIYSFRFSLIIIAQLDMIRSGVHKKLKFDVNDSLILQNKNLKGLVLMNYFVFFVYFKVCVYKVYDNNDNMYAGNILLTD